MTTVIIIIMANIWDENKEGSRVGLWNGTKLKKTILNPWNNVWRPMDSMLGNFLGKHLRNIFPGNKFFLRLLLRLHSGKFIYRFGYLGKKR